MSKLRPIAFVLPQFHPIPENDEWWGKGFTEWTNVKKAKPLFKGHYQPHLPKDLGFYDLRLPEARKAQADLAKDYGIHGFCYYHYWFNGKRLLNQPIDGMLQQKDLDMPFMLCWANENWTRTWDGLENDILIKQDYSLEDDKTHMRWLCKNIFSDPRYIRVDNKPVFIVYRQSLFPDISKTAQIWRDIAISEFGYKGLYLCTTESFNNLIPPEHVNFDAKIEFSAQSILAYRIKKTKLDILLEKFKIKKKSYIDVRDFKKGAKASMLRKLPDYKIYRSITPSWDNTPRKGINGIITINSSPNLYFKWLQYIVNTFKPYSKEENFIFINAMNEWGEGNHLEPCLKYGDSYLRATKKALEKAKFIII